MADVHYIYGLKNPEDDKIMYVGVTQNLKTRLKQHLAPSNLRLRSSKDVWIESLITKKIEPVVIVLEECTQEVREERERYWIDYYRGINPGLTNTHPGKIVGKTGRRSPSVSKSHKLLNIRLTDEQHSMLKELADEYGETMTKFLLRLIGYAKEKRPRFEISPKSRIRTNDQAT